MERLRHKTSRDPWVHTSRELREEMTLEMAEAMDRTMVDSVTVGSKKSRKQAE